MSVSIDDFALYLGDPGINKVRAAFILDGAQTLCETVVKPLPAGADVVILDVAERAFANPGQSGGKAFGLYAEGEGPYSDVSPGTTGGGLYLTQNNRATLRDLAGGGGAFMVDTMPAGAGLGLPWWDSGGVSAIGGDWDTPA